MDNVFKQMSILSILNIGLISCASRREGECYRNVRNEPSYVVFCCDNFEKKNGTCIACEKGYFSKDEGSCIPCTGSAYGQKCLHSCNCTEKQICNHIVGCIYLQSTRIETTIKDSTVLYSTIPTSETGMGEGKNTVSNNDTVIFNQDIVIYTVCIGGLLVVITICYICANRHRRKTTKQTQRYHRHQSTVRNGPNFVLPIQQNIIELESIYDEVDEISILLDDDLLPKKHATISNEPSSDDNSEGEHEDMKNEDYLNPYQPIVTDYEKHDYNTVTQHAEHNDRVVEKSVVHKEKEEIQFENATNMHEYLDVIDTGCENPINTLNTSSTTSGFSVQVCGESQCE